MNLTPDDVRTASDCPCSGRVDGSGKPPKACYLTEHDARQKRLSMLSPFKVARGQRPLRLREYRCPREGCGHWHLTKVRPSRGAA